MLSSGGEAIQTGWGLEPLFSGGNPAGGAVASPADRPGSSAG